MPDLLPLPRYFVRWLYVPRENYKQMKRLLLLPILALLCAFSCHAPTPPPPPTLHSVSLQWAGNSIAVLYNVYRGPACGSYVLIGAATTPRYTDSTVQAGQHLCYVVRALDALGGLSEESNTAEVTIRTP